MCHSIAIDKHKEKWGNSKVRKYCKCPETATGDRL